MSCTFCTFICSLVSSVLYRGSLYSISHDIIDISIFCIDGANASDTWCILISVLIISVGGILVYGYRCIYLIYISITECLDQFPSIRRFRIVMSRHVIYAVARPKLILVGCLATELAIQAWRSCHVGVSCPLWSSFYPPRHSVQRSTPFATNTAIDIITCDGGYYILDILRNYGSYKKKM